MTRVGRRDLVALVADDSPAMRTYLSALLARNGVDHVFEAGDGLEALRLLRDARPAVNVMFCDLDMPSMDGVDTLRRVALAHPEVSVVVFSAMDPRVMNTVARMSEVQGLEVLGILAKPFSEKDVRAQLDRWRIARRRDVQVQRVECTPDEIEAALKDDRIEVYYQPKVRLSDGVPVGVEALVRLRYPHVGIIAPSLFLVVAEAANLMPAITQRVLERSLQQASRWAMNGLSLDLAVNLAPSILRRLEWPDAIAGLAGRYGFPAERITLEVTEQHVDTHPEMLHNAARFRIKGFQLAVDDFGTGDSGISRLRSLPFTELKIDQSFTLEAASREDLRTLLQTSVELAHRLHMGVVAEGVETADQWAMLAQYGCDAVQGNYITPAIPADQIPDSLARWSSRVRVAAAVRSREPGTEPSSRPDAGIARDHA